MKHPIKSLILTALSLLSCGSEASLIDRGNGLIYDSDLDITWLKDANPVKTTGFDPDGRLNWAAANAWAAQLNVAGFGDWRLPGLTDSSFCIGSHCGNSELAHLFYAELGGQAETDLTLQHNGDYVLFSNVQGSVYWLKDELAIAPGVDLGWGFVTGGVLGGYQNLYNEGSEFHAWAVHAGDIGAQLNGGTPANVPLPAAGWLFVTALLGLLRRKTSSGKGT